LWEEGNLKLYKDKTERGVGPFQPKKHTPLKYVYQKYKTWSINTKPSKPDSLEKQMGHNPP
jgi:hypothetical protein